MLDPPLKNITELLFVGHIFTFKLSECIPNLNVLRLFKQPLEDSTGIDFCCLKDIFFFGLELDAPAFVLSYHDAGLPIAAPPFLLFLSQAHGYSHPSPGKPQALAPEAVGELL